MVKLIFVYRHTLTGKEAPIERLCVGCELTDLVIADRDMNDHGPNNPHELVRVADVKSGTIIYRNPRLEVPHEGE
jgi:hypothetical protein